MSYDSTLASDLDWVRFLIGDTDTADETIEDAEITAILAEEKNKYLAAHRCGQVLMARERANGVVSKTVEGLSLTFGDSPESSYRKHLQQLYEKGCELLLKKSRPFRVIDVV